MPRRNAKAGTNRPKESSAARKRRWKIAISRRDGWRCHYCPTMLNPNTATIDHVVPQSRGGSNERSNLVLSCVRCNQDKGTMSYRRFISEPR